MDIVRRGPPSERTAYPGIVVFALAAVGAVAALRRRGPKALYVFLLLVVFGAYILALFPSWGFGLSVYQLIPAVSQIRVPGRILVLATLALAALAAFGFTRLRLGRVPQMAVAVALMALLVFDHSTMTRNVASADVEPNLSPGVPRGARVLDLPPFDAGHFGGSRYMMQIIENPSARVGGYSVFATTEAWKAQQRTKQLANVPLDRCGFRDTARSFGYRHVAVHTALFGVHPKWPRDGAALIAALDQSPAFERISSTRDVIVYELDPDKLDCPR